MTEIGSESVHPFASSSEALMYDRIIVPVEKGAAVGSLERPRLLARALSCELTLLHVHRSREAPAELESITQYRYQHVVENWDGQDADAEAREAEWLADLADAVAQIDPELDVSSRVVHAPLSQCIGGEGEKVLVVAPVAGRDDDGLDPTAQELVRTCGVPVLLLRPAMSLLPIRRVLVALDGSPFSEEALVPAIDLARATGATLSLLEVVTRHSGLVRLLHPAERSAEAADRSLRAVADRLPPELGPVDLRVVEHGSATGGILLEAKRGGADLIAMATHGRGGLRRLLLGSVAESVVRAASVPVVVFRPQGVGAHNTSPDQFAGSSA
jgi:nucleotide-binding universal stress UspA family protein